MLTGPPRRGGARRGTPASTIRPVRPVRSRACRGDPSVCTAPRIPRARRL